MSSVPAEVAATVTDTAAILESPHGFGMINRGSNERETTAIAPMGVPPEEGIYGGGDDGGESRTASTRAAGAIVATAGSAAGAPSWGGMHGGREHGVREAMRLLLFSIASVSATRRRGVHV